MNAQTPGGANPKFGGRDILVIEDEELIASVVEEMLIDLGCRCVWIAATVKEALAVLAQHRPHAVVLDVNLGGDSGFQLAETLADAKIPFVFATGYGRQALPEQWAARPMIQKPFRFDTLATVLGALL
ncbi:MAG TPA: response regulator [Stellaceae bacterium]|jgi:CheY-like chemotaxis protein